MNAFVILMAVNGCFTNKTFVVPTLKRQVLFSEVRFVKRERSLLFGISRYLFASQEVNMPYLT